MKSRMSWLLGLLSGMGLVGVMVVNVMPAAAKSVPMRPVSRSAVDAACSRAGGSAFGIHDDSGSYGCSANRGSVECADDGTCFGSVSDLLPLAANSLDAVLGVRVRGQPIKIGPADHRIMRSVQH
jgi:hypothetical protein